MLIIEGNIGANIEMLLTRIHEEVPTIAITTYTQWLAARESTNKIPHGIIYIRVKPEIALMRIQQYTNRETSFTLDQLIQAQTEQELCFVEKKTITPEFKDLPMLVLNGNIDFTTDFAQFYNHLFYIKKFLKEIQEIHDLVHGVYKNEPKQHRHCC